MSSSHAHAHHDDGKVHAHISSFGFLCAIFATLIVLTVVTVGASYVDFGPANTVIAVLIATVKATLVSLFFMHLRHDRLFNALAFVMAFVFLGIFLVFTDDDISTRGRLDPDHGVHVYSRTGQDAPHAQRRDLGRRPAYPAVSEVQAEREIPGGEGHGGAHGGH